MRFLESKKSELEICMSCSLIQTFFPWQFLSVYCIYLTQSVDTRGTRSEIETLKLKVSQGIIHILRKLSPQSPGVEHWPYNPRVSGLIPSAGNLKKLFIWMKSMDSHKSHKAFIQMAKQFERMSSCNEWCSAPILNSFPACCLRERYAFTELKNKQ